MAYFIQLLTNTYNILNFCNVKVKITDIQHNVFKIAGELNLDSSEQMHEVYNST